MITVQEETVLVNINFEIRDLHSNIVFTEI